MTQRVIKVFFFGDSICFGQGVAVHKGWVTRISASLSDGNFDQNVEVMVANASINGNTTRQALERMPYDIQSQGADILLVQFGMNDCNYWETDQGNPRVSAKAFGANLEEIITRCLSFGVRKVLINTNHPTGRDVDLIPFADVTYQQSNERYNQVIREIAAACDDRVVLNDIEEVFRKRTQGRREALMDLLLPDLLHLSEQGHDLYYQTIHPRALSAVQLIIQEQ